MTNVLKLCRTSNDPSGQDMGARKWRHLEILDGVVHATLEEKASSKSEFGGGDLYHIHYATVSNDPSDQDMGAR